MARRGWWDQGELGRVERLLRRLEQRNLANESFKSSTPGLLKAARLPLGGSWSNEGSRWKSDDSEDLLHLIDDKE